MDVLVTGGAGFIGSHLVERLLGDDHRVVVIDDLSTGCVENLAAVAHHPELCIINGSTTRRHLVDDLVAGADAVFHLAAVVGVRRVLDDPVAAHETNVIGGANVVMSCAEQSRRLLITSSSEIYGRNADVPWREDADRVLGPTAAPRWSYANAKAGEEMLALMHHRRSALPVVIARLFNVVGPRQVGDHGMVLPRFVEAATRGEPLLVHGDGSQTRCFTGVDDVITALVALMNEPAARGLSVNVGSTEEISIAELARRVIHVTGSRSTIELVPYAEAFDTEFEDTHRRVPDSRLVEQLIGWKPRAGIDELIGWVVRASTGRR